jgi:O-antigen/teichoic acid export membrane protein
VRLPDLLTGAAGRVAFLTGIRSVAAGFLVAGLFTYCFLTLAGRVLGPAAFAPISTLWAMVFIVGPGLFLPLQQELGRVLAREPVEGSGALVLRRTAGLAAVVSGGAVVTGLLAGPWLTAELFGGHWSIFWCFEISVVAYAVSFLARGVFSGLGDFPTFGRLVAAESVIRFAVAGALVLVGIRTPGAFGAAIAVAPLLSTMVLTRLGRRLALAPGSDVGRRELLRAFGWLLMASLLGQALANAAPIAVQLLAPPDDDGSAGRFLSALVIARVAIYLFQAAQATIVPNFAVLSVQGRVEDVRLALRRMVGVCLGLTVVGTTGAYLLGPMVVRILFGPGFVISNVTMAILTAASTVYVLAAALSSAAIATGRHRLSGVAWLAGCVTFAAGTLLGHGLYERVELGYLVGSCVAAAVLLVGLARRIRHLAPAPVATGGME